MKAIAIPYTAGQHCPSVPIGVVELSNDIDTRKDQMLDLFTSRVFYAEDEEISDRIGFVMEKSNYGDFHVHWNGDFFLYFHVVT